MPAPPPDAAQPPSTLEVFCRRVLEAGDLASKLTDPLDAAGRLLPDIPVGRPLSPPRPARDPGLRMGSGGDALPGPGALVDASARRTCLSRFAHHELQAV